MALKSIIVLHMICRGFLRYDANEIKYVLWYMIDNGFLLHDDMAIRQRKSCAWSCMHSLDIMAMKSHIRLCMTPLVATKSNVFPFKSFHRWWWWTRNTLVCTWNFLCSQSLLHLENLYATKSRRTSGNLNPLVSSGTTCNASINIAICGIDKTVPDSTSYEVSFLLSLPCILLPYYPTFIHKCLHM
jgi:hypothetical protein